MLKRSVAPVCIERSLCNYSINLDCSKFQASETVSTAACDILVWQGYVFCRSRVNEKVDKRIVVFKVCCQIRKPVTCFTYEYATV